MNTARRKLTPITQVGVLSVLGYDEYFDCVTEDDTDEKDGEGTHPVHQASFTGTWSGAGLSRPRGLKLISESVAMDDGNSGGFIKSLMTKWRWLSSVCGRQATTNS